MRRTRINYLFSISISRRDVAIPLAVDSRIPAPSNRVHLPLRKIVIHNMYVPAPAPRHPLYQLLPEVIERYCHLHPRIGQVVIAVPQQHHLIVVRKIVVRYRYPRGPHHRVDQPVVALPERAVVDPDVLGPEYRDPVAVGLRTVPVVRRARPHVGIARGVAVVDVDVVDDDVGDVLEGDAPAPGDVDVGAAAVEGLEAVEDEFLGEADEHVGGEDYPQGLGLDHGVAEGAGAGVDRVVVGVVGDDVETTTFPA